MVSLITTRKTKNGNEEVKQRIQLEAVNISSHKRADVEHHLVKNMGIWERIVHKK